MVAQSLDAANRLTARTITPAAGFEGPTSETFAYDGLDRLTQAVSGTGPGGDQHPDVRLALPDDLRGHRRQGRLLRPRRRR